MTTIGFGDIVPSRFLCFQNNISEANKTQGIFFTFSDITGEGELIHDNFLRGTKKDKLFFSVINI